MTTFFTLDSELLVDVGIVVRHQAASAALADVAGEIRDRHRRQTTSLSGARPSAFAETAVAASAVVGGSVSALI